jgi:hypothetical protein
LIGLKQISREKSHELKLSRISKVVYDKRNKCREMKQITRNKMNTIDK